MFLILIRLDFFFGGGGAGEARGRPGVAREPAGNQEDMGGSRKSQEAVLKASQERAPGSTSNQYTFLI